MTSAQGPDILSLRMHRMAHNHKTPYNCIDVSNEDSILTPAQLPWYLFGKATRGKTTRWIPEN